MRLPPTLPEVLAKMEREGLTSRLLTTKELGAFLGVTTKTVAHWRTVGDGPTYFQLTDGGGIRYYYADVLRWLVLHEASSTLGANLKYVVDDSDG